MNATVKLRDPTFSESLAIESYKGAASGALAGSDSFADKVVTAAFSVATAYGAVIALVKPKDSQSTFLVVIPFIVIAIAVALALYAQSLAVSLEATNDLEAVRTRVAATIKKKRNWGRGAALVLVLGVVVAGVVVRDTYVPSARKQGRATIWLTPTGGRAVERACGTATPVTSLTGQVGSDTTLSIPAIDVAVDKSVCPSGMGTVVLPQRFVSVIARPA